VRLKHSITGDSEKQKKRINARNTETNPEINDICEMEEFTTEICKLVESY